MTTWGGLVITLFGAAYRLNNGGDTTSFTVTAVGVAITSIGHWIGIAQAKREKEAKEAAEQRIEELEGIAYEADEMLRDPHFKRLVERERMDYMIEHQDDGR